MLERAELNPGAGPGAGRARWRHGHAAAELLEEAAAAAAGEVEEVPGLAASEWHRREARCRGGAGLRKRSGAQRPYQCPLAVPAPPSTNPATG